MNDELREERAYGLELCTLCEQNATEIKAHAWTQTAWIFTLNAGVLGFSIAFFAWLVGAALLVSLLGSR